MIALSPIRQTKSQLRELQHWFQSAVVDGRPIDDSRIVSTDRFTREQRLGVYQNAYLVRLTECLENEFPVLVETVGKEAFTQFALGYLSEFPSRSYTLGKLSTNFIEFLEQSRPKRESTEPDWFDFVIDVARLESRINQSFDGPGIEALPGFTLRHDVQVDKLRLTLNPSLSVIRCCFPVHRYYQQIRDRQSGDFLQKQPTTLAIYRSHYIVKYRPITEFQSALLERIGETGNVVTALCGLDRLNESEVTELEVSLAMELFVGESFITLSESSPAS